ncbi:hypothetical protein NKI59_19495 [Mesorhizobium sp. M0598]|uniref:hypothetical protein n=1 Tax=Mesorhizobium sp. M0598 TaxID=2956968 RepID=UPI0033384814
MAGRSRIDWLWAQSIFYAGIVGFVIQVFWFLRDGVWSGLSLIDSAELVFWPSDWPWLCDPQSWQGLHLILNWVSLPLIIVLWGAVLRALEKPVRH